VRRSEALQWMETAAAATALGIESAGVIGLRWAGAVMGGPKAADEAWRMWSEKMSALAELQARLFSGSLGSIPFEAVDTTVKLYRRKVAANRRRLGRSA